MRYILLVTGPSYGTQNATSAWKFATALLKAQHHIDSIFFYQEGVTNANQLISLASDEHSLIDAWSELSQTHKIELNICVSAALRRGVTDEQDGTTNLHPSFNLAGLGALAQGLLTCDRVVQF